MNASAPQSSRLILGEMRQILQRPMYSGRPEDAKRARTIQMGSLHTKLCAIRNCAEVDFSAMPFDDDPVADHQAESRA